jgi:hypothetical protein
MNTIRTALLVSVFFVSACADAPVQPRTVTPPDHLAAAAARKKPPKVNVADEPVISITPAGFTLSVGQPALATIVYTQPLPANFLMFFWGCLPQPSCYEVVQIYPTPGTGIVGDPIAGGTATVTGLAPGSVSLYASDGLGAWAFVDVTVTP